MGQNIYVEFWKKVLQKIKDGFQQGESSVKLDVTDLAKLGDRSSYSGYVTFRYGEVIAKTDAAPYRDLIEAIKTTSALEPFVSGELTIKVNSAFLLNATYSKLSDDNTGDKVNYWVFQASPKVYRIVDALKDGVLKMWTVKQHKARITVGDKVILWVTGENAGIYALATVTSPVYETRDPEEELPYYTEVPNEEISDKVEMKLDYNLWNVPILKERVLEHPVLKDLKQGVQATNLLATEEQYKAILNIIKMTPADYKRTKAPLNQILYGPPGTGKTYTTINKALQIVDPAFYEANKNNRSKLTNRYNQLLIKDWSKPNGQIAFITFHQSMSYEDFIEGIKPVKPENSKTLEYEIQDGIFKKICTEASRTSKYTISLDGVQKTLTKELFADFYNSYSLPLPLQTATSSSITLKTKEGYPFDLFKNNAGSIVVKAGEKRSPLSVSVTELTAVLFDDKEPAYRSYAHIIIEKILEGKDLQKSVVNNANRNFVLIIDEINRGNISAIFGELISLIEEDKRKGEAEALEVILPYSKEPFSVPSNLYIIGTMNTADRSVEALDTALRRRFVFEEMMPDPSKLSIIEDVDLSRMLKVMNERLEVILDGDRTIGHAWFMGCKDLKDLKGTFENKVIPLLKEFFYNDYSKIGLIIGKAFVESSPQIKHDLLFADFNLDIDARKELATKKIYKLRIPEDDSLAAAFKAIYSSPSKVLADGEND